jgi:hypothetical protein
MQVTRLQDQDLLRIGRRVHEQEQKGPHPEREKDRTRKTPTETIVRDDLLPVKTRCQEKISMIDPNLLVPFERTTLLSIISLPTESVRTHLGQRLLA